MITVESIEKSENGGFVVILNTDRDDFRLVQNEFCTKYGLSVTPYGAIIYDGTPRDIADGTGVPIYAINEYGGLVSLTTSVVLSDSRKLIVNPDIYAGYNIDTILEM